MDNIITNNIENEFKTYKSEETKFKLFIKIVTFCLIAVFAIRLFSYTTNITEYIGLESSNLSPLVTAFCLIDICLQYTSVFKLSYTCYIILHLFYYILCI